MQKASPLQRCDGGWTAMGGLPCVTYFKESQSGSVQADKAIMQSPISVSYVKRLGKLVDEDKLGVPLDAVTDILAINQCRTHKT